MRLVKLTQSRERGPVYVNIEHVEVIRSENGKGWLQFNDRGVEVDETPEQIVKLLSPE
jgi:hypothetical protein